MVGEKLVTIQRELKAPKKQVNKFGNYKYRSCEDILEAAKPLVTRENCALVIADDIIQIGDRYYVKATATITDNEDNSSISVSAFAREPEDKKGSDASQVTGAASSYARKYCLNGLFLIDDTKDADVTNTGKKSAAPKVEESEELKALKKQIVDKCTELGGSKNEGVMSLVKDKAYGNPNSIKTEEAAKKYLEALEKIGK